MDKVFTVERGGEFLFCAKSQKKGIELAIGETSKGSIISEIEIVGTMAFISTECGEFITVRETPIFE